ncbi:tyrosine-protein phosphatase 10D [Trichonephila clavipes]|nr:tyrosine-protein phosphatase 10D [Trichonephila clavipes]
MSSRHHIDDFMRDRIIGKIEEGRKITDVAREFDIAHSVVSRLWKSFKTTGMCSRRHGGGRVRSTTPAEDRYIVLSAKRYRRTTAQQHRTARLQWCREHHNWTEQDWACVLFSDESRFSLSSDCRRQLILRESGTAYRPENIQEKDRYPTCSNMVWAGIMINGRTRLHVVANGTLTGQRYIDEVLLPHVRLFRGAVGDKFVFMDDNATCHRTFAVQDCLDSEGIQRLVWPARSPDLNPIENVWDALGRQVAGRNYPPTNKNTLIRALTEEWDKLPQQLLENVVQSMIQAHTKVGPGVTAMSEEKTPIWPPPPPEPSVTPKVVSRTSNTIKVEFSNHFFSSVNGKIIAYTIIVAEDDAKDSNALRIPSWADVQQYALWPPYQVLDPYYPFNQSLVEDFVVGTETCNGVKGYCNGPLKAASTYRIKLRAFTTPTAFTDTVFSYPVQTEMSSVALVRGNLVVNVTDSWPTCHGFEPSTAEAREGWCPLNI